MEELALKGMCRNPSQNSNSKNRQEYFPPSTLLSPKVWQRPSLHGQRASALREGLGEARGKQSSHVVLQVQRFKPGSISW